MAVPSPFHVIAATLSFFVALGIVDRLRHDAAVRAWTVYVVSFFLFIAHYHLLYVRHHLVALPWLAILFAAGVRRSLHESLSQRAHAALSRRFPLGACFALARRLPLLVARAASASLHYHSRLGARQASRRTWRLGHAPAFLDQPAPRRIARS